MNHREAYGRYACNRTQFNHESPRCGEIFMTRMRRMLLQQERPDDFVISIGQQ